jgi:hypothetical protein
MALAVWWDAHFPHETVDCAARALRERSRRCCRCCGPRGRVYTTSEDGCAAVTVVDGDAPPGADAAAAAGGAPVALAGAGFDDSAARAMRARIKTLTVTDVGLAGADFDMMEPAAETAAAEGDAAGLGPAGPSSEPSAAAGGGGGGAGAGEAPDDATSGRQQRSLPAYEPLGQRAAEEEGGSPAAPALDPALDGVGGRVADAAAASDAAPPHGPRSAAVTVAEQDTRAAGASALAAGSGPRRATATRSLMPPLLLPTTDIVVPGTEAQPQ